MLTELTAALIDEFPDVFVELEKLDRFVAFVAFGTVEMGSIVMNVPFQRINKDVFDGEVR